MAANFIKFNQQSDLGRRLVRGLQLIREGREVLRQWRAAMIQGCDGATNVAANFDMMATEVGYSAGDYADANAATMASFAEIDSLYAKLTATSTGDVTGAAIDQACAKHGV